MNKQVNIRLDPKTLNILNIMSDCCQSSITDIIKVALWNLADEIYYSDENGYTESELTEKFIRFLNHCKNSI